MTKKLETKRFCGNCHHHSTFEYPNLIFCFKRFEQRKNAIFSAFDHCEHWELQSQECFCVSEMLQKRVEKEKIAGYGVF